MGFLVLACSGAKDSQFDALRHNIRVRDEDTVQEAAHLISAHKITNMEAAVGLLDDIVDSTLATKRENRELAELMVRTAIESPEGFRYALRLSEAERREAAAEQARARAEQEKLQAEQEKALVEQEKALVDLQAEQEKLQADEEIAKLRARIAELEQA